MPPEPVPADPGWDEDLAWLDRDPERESWLDRAREHDEPPEPEEEYEDHEPLTAEELAGIREAAADELLAVEAASTGRRGPGQPGSARVFPGESSSPAAAFGPGMVFDVLPGCAQLAVAADAAAGDDGFAGISEAELVGIMCAWDRVEAHAAARKLAAVAELDRRNPEPGDAEFTADQIANALGESRFRADELTGTAGHLDTHLPGTQGGAARRHGEPGQGPDHRHRHRPARPGRGRRGRGRGAGPGRAADPRRAARRDRPRGDRRPPRIRRGSGGRPRRGSRGWSGGPRTPATRRWRAASCPRTEVLAADERITARARELKAAGLEGGMDELRARALLDLLLGQDSRPGQDQAQHPRAPRPGGFASRVTLTAPLATLTRLAGQARRARRARPGRPVADPRPGHRRRAQPEDDLVRDRHRSTWGTPSATAAPAPNPGVTGNAPDPAPRRARRVLLRPGQPGRPAPASTAPGGCAPPDPGRT